MGKAAVARLKSTFEPIPVWYLWFQAFSLLNTEVRLLEPPRRDFAPTVLSPLIWFAAYYLVKPRNGTTRNLWNGMLLVTLSCAVPAVLILVVLPRTPRPPELLMRDAELVRLILATVLALHSWFSISKWAFIKFFVAAFVYGAVLESGGIAGGFFNEPGYMLYIPGVPAPFVNIVGWCVVIYVSVYVWQKIMGRFEGRRWRTAVFAMGVTAVALSQDLQIDPYATRAGWWIWHDSLPAGFLGVPVLNFLAWISAVFPFGWSYWYIETRTGTTELGRIMRLFLAVPIALVVALAIVLVLTVIFRGASSPDMALFRQALLLSW